MGAAPRPRGTVVTVAGRAPALVAALATLVIVGGALTLAHHPSGGPLSARVAIQDLQRSRALPRLAPGLRWDRVVATPLDSTLERVDYFHGSQIVAEFALDRRGAIRSRSEYAKQSVPYGEATAYQPAVLAGLALLFVLMSAVSPLRRIQNLDVVAILSLLAPVVLLEHRYLAASVIAALPGLGYLLGRCAWVALGSPSGTRASRSTPLFEHLARRLEPDERQRILRILLFAVAAVVVMVGVSSPRAVDVVYAVMEGATKLLHGALPYGHLPGDVVHGDTYPILSYLAYVPVALVAPVRSTWDSVDAALGFGALAALGGAAAVWVAVRRSDGDTVRDTAPLRATIAWLTFPALLITVSTGTTDVLLAALIAWALAARRRPAMSGGLLAAGGWLKLAPFALVPIWLAPLRGRRLAAAVGAIAAVSAAMLVLVLVLGGVAGLSAMVRAVSFQASRGSPQSLWSALGIESLQPLGQGCVAALVVGATVRFARAPELGVEGRRLAGISAAVLIAAQLATNYWAFLYTIWLAPLLSASLLLARDRAAERLALSEATPELSTVVVPA